MLVIDLIYITFAFLSGLTFTFTFGAYGRSRPVLRPISSAECATTISYKNFVDRYGIIQ